MNIIRIPDYMERGPTRWHQSDIRKCRTVPNRSRHWGYSWPVLPMDRLCTAMLASRPPMQSGTEVSSYWILFITIFSKHERNGIMISRSYLVKFSPGLASVWSHYWITHEAMIIAEQLLCTNMIEGCHIINAVLIFELPSKLQPTVQTHNIFRQVYSERSENRVQSKKLITWVVYSPSGRV